MARVAVLALLLPAGPAVFAATRANVAPTASFTVSPSSPVTGERVTLTSTSSDSDGSIASQAWDLDNDGFYDDGTTGTVTTTAGAAGSYTVRLRVVDNGGSVRTTSKVVVVNANGAPVAAFSASPGDPETGQTITLTSSSTDPDGRALVEDWDLNNDGTYGDKSGHQVTTSFADNGVRRVSLRVTDSGGSVRTSSRDLTVRNRAPQAAFGVSATAVDTGEAIDFSSSSSDPDGTIRSYEWDFDGNGSTDATGPTVRRSFADSGTPTVTLKVTDDDGDARSASRQLTIRNRAPSAAFGYAPNQPLTGQEVVLTSTSSDPDGTLAQQRWDLDGDGAFDDATGASARTTFATAGSHTVALQVADDDGATAGAFATIEVARRPVPAAPPPAAPQTLAPLALAPATPIAPRLLNPFPRVRMRGVTTRVGVRLDVLSVRTRGGTRITVRCKGRGCPWKGKVQRASFSAGSVRRVRIPGFKRRYLRAGAVVEIYVTARNAIGKYARIEIRRLKAPKRVEGCTAPGAARARRCPAS